MVPNLFKQHTRRGSDIMYIIVVVDAFVVVAVVIAVIVVVVVVDFVVVSPVAPVAVAVAVDSPRYGIEHRRSLNEKGVAYNGMYPCSFASIF
jgi:hypothetical protein